MLLLTLYMLFCIFEKYLFYFLPHWRLGVTLKILQSFRLFCNWIFVVFHLKVGSVHFILTRARSFISARVVCDIFIINFISTFKFLFDFWKGSRKEGVKPGLGRRGGDHSWETIHEWKLWIHHGREMREILQMGFFFCDCNMIKTYSFHTLKYKTCFF